MSSAKHHWILLLLINCWRILVISRLLPDSQRLVGFSFEKEIIMMSTTKCLLTLSVWMHAWLIERRRSRCLRLVLASAFLAGDGSSRCPNGSRVRRRLKLHERFQMQWRLILFKNAGATVCAATECIALLSRRCLSDDLVTLILSYSYSICRVWLRQILGRLLRQYTLLGFRLLHALCSIFQCGWTWTLALVMAWMANSITGLVEYSLFYLLW